MLENSSYYHNTMTAKLVGILNITPDSFSDGGQYNNINSALQHTQTLISEGADIIDIGAESTRPKAKLLSPQLEWQRLKPLLPQIIKLCHQCNIPVSLDTRHAINAKKGLDLGIDIINDVSGLSDMAMIQLIKSYHKPIIINHNLGLPANPNVTISENENPINIIMQWGKNKISALETQHHITKQNIIFDVGIGFGKTARQSLQILANIKTFKKLADRKSTRLNSSHSSVSRMPSSA